MLHIPPTLSQGFAHTWDTQAFITALTMRQNLVLARTMHSLMPRQEEVGPTLFLTFEEKRLGRFPMIKKIGYIDKFSAHGK